MPKSPPDISKRESVVVVSARHDIDIATALEFRDVVLHAVPNQASGVVIDLSQIRYVDSAGIRVLVALAERLRTRRQALRLVLPPAGAVRRIISIAGLESSLGVADSMDEAMRALMAAGGQSSGS